MQIIDIVGLDIAFEHIVFQTYMKSNHTIGVLVPNPELATLTASTLANYLRFFRRNTITRIMSDKVELENGSKIIVRPRNNTASFCSVNLNMLFCMGHPISKEEKNAFGPVISVNDGTIYNVFEDTSNVNWSSALARFMLTFTE